MRHAQITEYFSNKTIVDVATSDAETPNLGTQLVDQTDLPFHASNTSCKSHEIIDPTTPIDKPTQKLALVQGGLVQTLSQILEELFFAPTDVAAQKLDALDKRAGFHAVQVIQDDL